MRKHKREHGGGKRKTCPKNGKRRISTVLAGIEEDAEKARSEGIVQNMVAALANESTVPVWCTDGNKQYDYLDDGSLLSVIASPSFTPKDALVRTEDYRRR